MPAAAPESRAGYRPLGGNSELLVQRAEAAGSRGSRGTDLTRGGPPPTGSAIRHRRPMGEDQVVGQIDEVVTSYRIDLTSPGDNVGVEELAASPGDKNA